MKNEGVIETIDAGGLREMKRRGLSDLNKAIIILAVILTIVAITVDHYTKEQKKLEGEDPLLQETKYSRFIYKKTYHKTFTVTLEPLTYSRWYNYTEAFKDSNKAEFEEWKNRNPDFKQDWDIETITLPWYDVRVEINKPLTVKAYYVNRYLQDTTDIIDGVGSFSTLIPYDTFKFGNPSSIATIKVTFTIRASIRTHWRAEIK